MSTQAAVGGVVEPWPCAFGVAVPVRPADQCRRPVSRSYRREFQAAMAGPGLANVVEESDGSYDDDDDDAHVVSGVDDEALLRVGALPGTPAADGAAATASVASPLPLMQQLATAHAGAAAPAPRTPGGTPPSSRRLVPVGSRRGKSGQVAGPGVHKKQNPRLRRRVEGSHPRRAAARRAPKGVGGAKPPPRLRKGVRVGGGPVRDWSVPDKQTAAAASLLAPVLARAIALATTLAGAVLGMPSQPVAAAFVAAAVAAAATPRVVTAPATHTPTMCCFVSVPTLVLSCMASLRCDCYCGPRAVRRRVYTLPPQWSVT